MRRILVAEDEDAIRDFIVINLKRSGYEVFDAPNGKIAYEMFEENPTGFDVAILDIMMPEMDGFTLCKKIREKSSSIGIIMLSAKTQEMDKVNGLMLGADDYVTKPFSPSELVARVDAIHRRVTMASQQQQTFEITSRPFCHQPKEPDPDQKRQADRPDPGGVPDYGISFEKPQCGAGAVGHPQPRLGGKLLWRHQDCGRQHPPAADED